MCCVGFSLILGYGFSLLSSFLLSVLLIMGFCFFICFLFGCAKDFFFINSCLHWFALLLIGVKEIHCL